MSASYLSIRPVTRKAPRGWLAVSAPGSPLKIAVKAPTRDAALSQFNESLAAWERLRTLPEGYVS